jgi:hypothetical protein
MVLEQLQISYNAKQFAYATENFHLDEDDTNADKDDPRYFSDKLLPVEEKD